VAEQEIFHLRYVFDVDHTVDGKSATAELDEDVCAASQGLGSRAFFGHEANGVLQCVW
jgi:hypothetical protein